MENHPYFSSISVCFSFWELKKEKDKKQKEYAGSDPWLILLSDFFFFCKIT